MYILCMAHLVVHLPGQVLQLHPGVLQRLFLHVVRRGVGQQLVEGDNVARNLRGEEKNSFNLQQKGGQH